MSIDRGKIHFQSHYDIRDRVKKFPFVKWDKKAKAWIAPASPMAIKALVDEHKHDCKVTMTKDANDLYKQAQSQHLAMDRLNLSQPEIRKTEAYPYQLEAYHMAMTRPATMLGMYMGTGKTKVAIDVLQNIGDLQFCLIMCPKSVIEVWPKEIEVHCAIPVNVVTLTKGTVEKKARKVEAILKSNPDTPTVFVMNYEAAWRDEMAEVLLSVVWDLVICDEIHRIKSPTGRASKFAAKLFYTSNKRLGLTGTPMPNGPIDVFGQFRFLDPGIFGDVWTRFKNIYAEIGYFNEVKGLKPHMEKEFNKRFYSISYVIGKEEALSELPEETHQIIPFELSSKTQKIYKQMEEEMVAYLDEDGEEAVDVDCVLAKIAKLQQITGGSLIYEDENGDRQTKKLGTDKEDLLADLLSDYPKDEPVAVFAHFHSELDAIKRACEKTGRSCGELSGKRNDLKDWQNGKLDVLAIQIHAGGLGIDLRRGHITVYYSTGYSLDDYEQSLARMHRKGQKEGVIYYHLVAKDTIDEEVANALMRKKRVVDYILNLHKEGGSVVE